MVVFVGMEAALANLSAQGPQELLRVTRTALKIAQNILLEEDEKFRRIRTASKVSSASARGPIRRRDRLWWRLFISHACDHPCLSCPLHAQFASQPGARQLLEAMGFQEEVSTACLRLLALWLGPPLPSKLLQEGACV